MLPTTTEDETAQIQNTSMQCEDNSTTITDSAMK